MTQPPFKFGRGPNVGKRFAMPEPTRELLHQLYYTDGAWTEKETVHYLTLDYANTLIEEGVLGVQDTDMGRMVQLLARGRASIYHTVDNAASLSAQLDQAYLRLCIKQKGWEVYTLSFPKLRQSM
ncbi:hypothetical protein ACFOPQ_14065 [Deinococcus antarcticus]|uniref:Uncharacterized protein n=1 Tax=Deinococcus antarcticus TaxID=1298767 RepID=A0ABV8A8T3_9DEIO